MRSHCLFPIPRFLRFILAVWLAGGSAEADITGQVFLKGKPNSQDETFVARANGCGESAIRHTENWKIGPKGELAEVVVWIVDPKLEPKIASKLMMPAEVTVRQLGCRYVPHVIAVQAGIPFKIINGDPTIHNVHAKVSNGPAQPPGDDVFNFGQTSQGEADEREFDQPGIYTLQCDVHNWMQCWVRVIPHRFFGVTDEKGAFVISDGGLPLQDGDYKIDAWHPRFVEPVEQIAHVKNGTANVSISFDGAKSF
ncbi:MAG: hypothetical protein LV480_09180 [Methylacidiphilales bacterium]|nr:hypothetical protein [Candidatus Methylacidiphilales bacterium]